MFSLCKKAAFVVALFFLNFRKMLSKYIGTVCRNYYAIFLCNRAKNTGDERWYLASLGWDLAFWIFLRFSLCLNFQDKCWKVGSKLIFWDILQLGPFRLCSLFQLSHSLKNYLVKHSLAFLIMIGLST